MRKVRLGFTLIELLVVIAIIAILAAILFPVFSQARAKAYQSACLSNIRNVAMATAMYAQDWDEKFMLHITPCGSEGAPKRPADPWDPLQNPDWYMSIQPYVRNTGVFDCQGRGRLDTWKSHCFPTQRGRAPYGYPVDYGFSEAIFNYPDLFALPAIQRPTQTVTGGDNENTFFNPWSQTREGINVRCAFANGFWTPHSTRCGCPAEILDPTFMDELTRHTGGSNMMFADGHAKWDRWMRIKSRRVGGPYDIICPDIIGRAIPSWASWQTWPRLAGKLAVPCSP
jgi:prepilin-type N-terminal cleavage/methylation domain-containing protein/prepilin-type processing-associated H-X9-DG protein